MPHTTAKANGAFWSILALSLTVRVRQVARTVLKLTLSLISFYFVFGIITHTHDFVKTTSDFTWLTVSSIRAWILEFKLKKSYCVFEEIWSKNKRWCWVLKNRFNYHLWRRYSFRSTNCSANSTWFPHHSSSETRTMIPTSAEMYLKWFSKCFNEKNHEKFSSRKFNKEKSPWTIWTLKGNDVWKKTFSWRCDRKMTLKCPDETKLDWEEKLWKVKYHFWFDFDVFDWRRKAKIEAKIKNKLFFACDDIWR